METKKGAARFSYIARIEEAETVGIGLNKDKPRARKILRALKRRYGKNLSFRIGVTITGKAFV